jgi:hypothetical protein
MITSLVLTGAKRMLTLFAMATRLIQAPSAAAATAVKRFVLPPDYQAHNGGVAWEDRLSHLDVMPEVKAATVPVEDRPTAKRRLASEDDLE